MKEKISEWFNNREDEFVSALSPLIEIDSTKGEKSKGAPFGEGPKKALLKALDLAEKWGLKVENVDGFVGTANLNENEDELHILAHLDVVGVGEGWDTDPFTLVRKGDMIYGRGTDDDKGPAVAAMLALRCLKELNIPLSKNAKLILGTDEESGSEDIEYYYSKFPYAPYSVTPDAEFPVINIEKGRYAPKFGCQWERADNERDIISIKGGIRSNVAPGSCKAEIKGVNLNTVKEKADEISNKTGVEFEIKETNEIISINSKGAEAHASTPDEGKNAITALLELLSKLPFNETKAFSVVKALNKFFPYGDNEGKSLGVYSFDEKSGKLTLAFSLLELNEKGFNGQFDVRAPLSSNEENLVKKTESEFKALGWFCKGEKSPVHYVDENSNFIKTLLKSYEEVSGEKGYCIAIGGGTYVHDIPGGVAFGAGEIGFDSHLHGANERARISRLIMTSKIYAQMIYELCK